METASASAARPSAIKQGVSAWLENASLAVTDAIATATASQSSRKQKLLKASDNNGTAKSPERDEEPVTSSFVTGVVSSGLQAAMKAMGEATEGRFVHIETAVGSLREEMASVKSGMDTITFSTSTDIATMHEQITELQTNETARDQKSEQMRAEMAAALEEAKRVLEEAKAAAIALPPGIGSSATGSQSLWSPPRGSQQTGGGGMPHEMRTEALLSGLGWGITPEETLTRANDILRQAGIPEDWHHGVTVNNRGTAIFLSFKEASQLRLASNKVRRLTVMFGQSKPWLDARRTRAENRPNRCIHKAAEAVAELHEAITRAGQTVPYENVTKNMRLLSLTAGERGMTICYFDARRMQLAWSQAALTAYTTVGKQGELDQIAAWCSLE